MAKLGTHHAAVRGLAHGRGDLAKALKVLFAQERRARGSHGIDIQGVAMPPHRTAREHGARIAIGNTVRIRTGPCVKASRKAFTGLVDLVYGDIFGQEGIAILHISGLIAAMSHETTECCLALAKAAKQYGTLISFDLNYRATFWKGREEVLSKAFHEIASCADVLIGNEEDFQLCLGFKGPEAGGKDLGSKIESFQAMITQVQEKYPNAKMFATTLRQVISANEHLWGAILLADGRWYVEEPREIQVMDRIGGGDGFSGGLLYGVLNGWEPEKCLQFGWASGVLAASSLNDYAEPADEKQVWDIYKGNARVQR